MKQRRADRFVDVNKTIPLPKEIGKDKVASLSFL